LIDPPAERLREGSLEHEMLEARAWDTAPLDSRLAIDVALPFDPAQFEAGLIALRGEGLAQRDGPANGSDDGADSGAARIVADGQSPRRGTTKAPRPN